MPADSSSWEIAGLVLGGLTPLLGVPLTVMIVYLRALREQQSAIAQEIRRRIESGEAVSRALRTRLGNFEREYTTKDEWVRELALMRRDIETVRDAQVQLRIESAIRLERLGARRNSYAGSPSAPAADGSTSLSTNDHLAECQ